MSNAERKAALNIMFEEGRGDPDRLAEWFAEEVCFHRPGGEELTGLDELKVAVREVLEAFPDFEQTPLAMVAEGDTIAVQSRASGTQTGEYQGVPATGNHGSLLVHTFYRFDGDKIVEAWELMDRLELMQALGVAPEG